MNKRIGFIGLGVMGLPMAKNLVKAGFNVIGHDVNKSVYDKAQSMGISMVDKLSTVAAEADDAIISMVRDYQQNVNVIFGDDGLRHANNNSSKTIIVMSTLSPRTMNELATKVKGESNFNLISAAVSGGSTGAEAGTLSIMASGPQELVQQAQPYFDAMGSHTFYFGADAGSSQVAKLANNIILAINMNAVAEALKLGQLYGLPEDEILKLLAVSTGDSWVARNWNYLMTWDKNTGLGVLLKDLKAAHEEGMQNKITLPFNELSAEKLFESMKKEL